MAAQFYRGGSLVATVASPLTAWAQQPERMRRIGALMLYAENEPAGQSRSVVFRKVGKRLELLRETVPKLSRVGFVIDPDYAAADGTLNVVLPAARALDLDARVYEVRSGAELEAAFAAAVRDGVQALYVPEAPLLLSRRAEIAEMAMSMRLPAIYTFREYVQSGGLMSYGSDLPELYRRSATYVDKILKGAKPGELPLQTAEKFELAVNLKTAKTMGLTFSQAFLLRADEVIE